MTDFRIAAARFVAGLVRPSKEANRQQLESRGESVSSLVIREPTESDIPALAQLHVTTWNDTYAPLLMNGPPVSVRAYQWREAFAKNDGSWFCYVIQAHNGELVGFAKGTRDDPSSTSGQLSKIYLLRDYQRMGLGRRLVGLVVRRFFSQGVTQIWSFVDPRNPSCAFYEALGAENPIEDGKVNDSSYVWNDLHKLAAICSAE
jgi:RimJ/RimL family protein N-acetyltransferase